MCISRLQGIILYGLATGKERFGFLASAFSQVIGDVIRIEEESELPSGLALQAMNNKISATPLYGPKEIYRWINKHN